MRALLNGSPATLPPLLESEPNDTLDLANAVALPWAQPAGAAETVQLQLQGQIGSASGPSADVDWFSFSLDRAAEVQLSSQGQQGVVLSLYNTDTTSGDVYDPLQHRQLAQSQGGSLDLPLGQGQYYLAVSGQGNQYFNPFLADSGYPGAGGPYEVQLTATSLAATASGLPAVLGTDLSAGAGSSPLTIHVDLSGPLNPAETANLNVQLLQTDLPTASQSNLVGRYSYSSDANELVLQLNQALAPGSYQLTIDGSATDGTPVLDQPFSYSFQVAGVEGNSPAVGTDDTPAGAAALTLTPGQLTQVGGAIGDDPAAGYFDANNVDVYHFEVSGQDRQAFVAEAFAGRIGSPLQPALSLFEVANGQLQLVASNTGGGDLTLADAASPVAYPLQNDPVLFAGLTAGSYYLVVSSNGNLPSSASAAFDPAASFGTRYSQGGWTTGPYVLNLFMQPDDVAPTVVSVTAVNAGGPTDPPAAFEVQFSEPVNLLQSANQFGLVSLPSVYVQAADGTTIPLKMTGYDPDTNEAEFILLQRLPPGSYTLHLSGSDPTSAITDLAGNPLVGNNPTGLTTDYLFAFQVTGAGRSTSVTGSAGTPDSPQDLGTLASFELQDSVQVTGAFPGAAADGYQFEVYENCQYNFSLQDLSGASLPPGTWLTLTDVTTGKSVFLPTQGLTGTSDPSQQVDLSSGSATVGTPLMAWDTYVLAVHNWSAGASYRLTIAYGGSGEAPPPLVVGPAPVIRLRLNGDATSVTAAPTPVPAPAPGPIAGPPLAALTATDAGAGPPPAFAADSGRTIPALGTVPAAGLVVEAGAHPEGASVRTSAGAAPLATLPTGVPGSVFLALGAPTQAGGQAVAGSSPRPDLFERLFGQMETIVLGQDLPNEEALSKVNLVDNGGASEAMFTAAGPWSTTTWGQVTRSLGQLWQEVSTGTPGPRAGITAAKVEEECAPQPELISATDTLLAADMVAPLPGPPTQAAGEEGEPVIATSGLDQAFRLVVAVSTVFALWAVRIRTAPEAACPILQPRGGTT